MAEKTFLNDLESDPTNETDQSEHSLPIEIMKSIDEKIVIGIYLFIF